MGENRDGLVDRQRGQYIDRRNVVSKIGTVVGGYIHGMQREVAGKMATERGGWVHSE